MMEAPASPPLSIDSMVEICRKYPGSWLDLFQYEFRGSRSRWVFSGVDGVTTPVSETYMPQIAHELGGWPSREAA